MKMSILIPVLVCVLLILYREKVIADWQSMRRDFRRWLYLKWKNWGEPFLIAALLAIVIRTYLMSPYKIPTGSMKPTFMEGDRIFVNKISYRFHEPERGDILVFKYPFDRRKDFVKRLVGLPGDRISIRQGIVYLNGEALQEPPFADHYYYNRSDWLYGRADTEFKVPAGNFFVLGDNSPQSSDSRHWGFVPRVNVIGKAVLIWWPPSRIKFAK
ncbi:MAG: signal peptidase I [Candidatus Omnitrophota bacterium]